MSKLEKHLAQCVVIGLIGSWTVVRSAAAADSDTAPGSALVVTFEASAASRLPAAEIRAALAEELRRPIEEVPSPELPQIRIAMDGPERVVVRYAPPPGELERSIVLPEPPSGVAPLVSTIAKELVYRDAGITLPQLAKSAPDAGPETAAATPGGAPATSAPPVTDAGASSSARREGSGGRGPVLSAFTRVGGFTVVTTGGGRGTADFTVGAGARLDLPVSPRFSIGTELGWLSFQTGFLPGNDQDAEIDRATYADIAIVPSYLLTSLASETQVRLAAAAGLTLPLEMRGRNLDSSADAPGDGRTYSYSGEAGYRLAAILNGTHWFDERWGLHAALGVEHHFTLSTRAELPVDGPVRRDFAKVWSTEPVIQVGAALRF